MMISITNTYSKYLYDHLKHRIIQHSNSLLFAWHITCLRKHNASQAHFRFCWAHSQNCEKWLLAMSRQSFCPSIHMEQHSFHWMDFHEILYLSIFQKSVMKIQVWLTSDRTNGYFTRRPMFNRLTPKNRIWVVPQRWPPNLAFYTFIQQI